MDPTRLFAAQRRSASGPVSVFTNENDSNRLTKVVLTSTNNLCFEQKYENYQNFSSESFYFLMVKFSVYLNRHVFVMVL